MQPLSRPHPHPHSSTSSHLATETALLQVLYTRSKHQHRSQIFLARLHRVLRLSKRVIASLYLANNPPHASSSSSTQDLYGTTRRLLPNFCTSLLHAAGHSTAILELNHFAPLHTTLLSAYARLLSVSLALGAALGLSQAALLLSEAERRKASPKAPVAASDEPAGEDEVGEVIARPAPARPTSPKPPRELVEADVAAEPRKRKARLENGMDEIFGKTKKRTKAKVKDKGREGTGEGKGDEGGANKTDPSKTSGKKPKKESTERQVDKAPADPSADPADPADPAPKPKKPKAIDAPKRKSNKDKPKKPKAKGRSTMDAIFGF
ncbi:unnamed protein product [Cutaneotrichosporon oleaginosum]